MFCSVADLRTISICDYVSKMSLPNVEYILMLVTWKKYNVQDYLFLFVLYCFKNMWRAIRFLKKEDLNSISALDDAAIILCFCSVCEQLSVTSAQIKYVLFVVLYFLVHILLEIYCS